MRRIVLVVGLSVLAGCASIGRDQVEHSAELLKGLSRQEVQFVGAMDSVEDTARKKLELEMRYVIGPEIIKEFMKAHGEEFAKGVCEATGVNQALELLEFVMDMSWTYEERQKKEWKKVGPKIITARRVGRNEYDLQRRGLSSLHAALRAYAKDKKWQKEVLRQIGVPVDKVDALNKSTLKIKNKIEEVK